MNYILRYGITPLELVQRFIDEEVTEASVSKYENRAQKLSDAGNAFLNFLKVTL